MADAPTPGSIQPTDEAALTAARALVALVRPAHSPQRFYKSERGWRIAAAAMVFRMADTVESIMALMEGRYALDTLILLRALYEQVVTFCWLAIDPEKHIDLWGKNEHYWQRKLHEDALAYGHTALSPEGLKATEDAKKQDPIPKLAEAVDGHWGGRLIGFREPQSDPKDLLNFRGLYLGIYRTASRAAHIQPESLAPYGDFDPYPVVVSEARWERSDLMWWSLAVPLYAQALIVCNAVLKWPDVDQVLAINNKMYGLA
jgi:hypothetical protein